MLILSLIIQLNTCAIIEDVNYIPRIECTIPVVGNVAIELGFNNATQFKDYYLAVYKELNADKRRNFLQIGQRSLFK